MSEPDSITVHREEDGTLTILTDPVPQQVLVTGELIVEMVDAHNRRANVNLEGVLWHCFRHFYHLDHSNAPIHTAEVRYSPLTFRLAEILNATFPFRSENRELRNVLGDRGAYEEDLGR